MPIKPQRTFALTQVLFLVFIVTVPAFLQMCGIEAGSVSQVRMVNGSLPGLEHPASWSAVALIEKSSGEQFCSGTLIAPQLIVTAAHCVFDKRAEDMQLLFGPSVQDPSSVKRDVLAKETFKKFQKFESNFDIAWLKFAGDVPVGYRPIEVWNSSQQLKAKTPLSIAGFGRTASQCEDGDASCQGGVRMYVDTEIREFVNHARLFNLIVIGPRPQHGPCFGDSGGPAYMQVDGKWYVIGDFMGWDRLLVPEKIETICDGGEAIYNFVGDFVLWIESTSGISLAYDAEKNPRQEAPQLISLQETPQNFQGWCENNNHEDPSWFTVQRLLRAASDYRMKTEDPSKAREVFEDCAVAEVWIRKMLNEQKTLEIAGFDPANFVDSARLEDVRPLLAFADTDLEELVLTDHSIADLSPLAHFTKLKKLEIIDNIPPPAENLQTRPVFELAALTQLEDLKIHNSMAPVSFRGLEALKHLQGLELSYLKLEDGLPGLSQLSLKNLRLDSLETKEPITLPGLGSLKSVFLSKIAVGALPSSMPELQTLELLETTQLKALPKDAPKLRKLFLYASDYQGELTFGNWSGIEELSVMSNEGIESVTAIQNLAKLRSIELVENKIRSLGPIQNLPRLKTLSLMRNQLTGVPELSGLPLLEKIDLDGNQISGTKPLQQLPKLEYLNLSRNQLVDLKGIEGLKALKRLSVQNRKGAGLHSLDGLAQLPALEELNVAKNSIPTVESLVAFANLKVLVLSDNAVKDLSPLKALSQLEYIEAVNNPLDKKECPLAKANACRFEWLVFRNVNKP